MQQRDESTPGAPIWPTQEPGGQQDVPEYRPPTYSTAEYPTQSAYPTLDAGHMSTYGRVRSEPPEQRRGSGKLVAGVSVLALLVGGAAGGVGGYLVADSQQSPSSSVVNALEQEPPAKQTVSAPKGSVEAVAAKVTPSVVQLQVEGAGTAGEGSGFVLTDDGFIMTNNHVVEAAADGNGRIRAIFADGQRANVSVVGRDPATDVAVVKAEGVSGLVPVELGRSDDLRVGQSVVAIGSPFELSGTVTSGIISALNRPVTAGGAGGGQASAMDAVQTDAAINPGNSGGPLVNMQGRVIGINSAIYSPRSADSPESSGAGNVGIGFAIPIDQAKRTAEQLMKTGKATTTYIGANVRDNPDGGASIVKVLPNSPAEKAGLEAGDVVTKLDDRPIDDANELVAAIRTRAAGEKVTFTVDGSRTLEVTLGVQPAGAGN